MIARNRSLTFHCLECSPSSAFSSTIFLTTPPPAWWCSRARARKLSRQDWMSPLFRAFFLDPWIIPPSPHNPRPRPHGHPPSAAHSPPPKLHISPLSLRETRNRRPARIYPRAGHRPCVMCGRAYLRFQRCLCRQGSRSRLSGGFGDSVAFGARGGER